MENKMFGVMILVIMAMTSMGVANAVAPTLGGWNTTPDFPLAIDIIHVNITCIDPNNLTITAVADFYVNGIYNSYVTGDVNNDSNTDIGSFGSFVKGDTVSVLYHCDNGESNSSFEWDNVTILTHIQFTNISAVENGDGTATITATVENNNANLSEWQVYTDQYGWNSRIGYNTKFGTFVLNDTEDAFDNTSNWVDATLLNDNNVSTCSQSSGGDAYFYSNYTVPEGIIGAYDEFTGHWTATNNSIPTDCLGGSTLRTRMVSKPDPLMMGMDLHGIQCQSNSDDSWINIFAMRGHGTTDCEESIYWQYPVQQQTKTFLYDYDGVNMLGINWYIWTSSTDGDSDITPTYLGAGNPPPTFSNPTSSSGLADSNTTVTLDWVDWFGLSGYIFSTNATGTWVNESYVDMIGTSNTSTATFTLPSAGTTVGWKFYANNTGDMWTESDIYTILPENAPYWHNVHTSSIGYTLTNFKVDWTDDYGLDSYIFSTNDSGSWVNDSAKVFGLSTCYQEQANESTIGDGSCNLIYTGNYDVGGLNYELMDKDWSTYVSAVNYYDANGYWNYTIPNNINSAKFTYKISWGGVNDNNTFMSYNETIPQTCLDNSDDNLQFKLHIFWDTGGSMNYHGDLYCWDGSNWLYINELGHEHYRWKLYEEAMWWAFTNDSLTQTVNVTQNVYTQGELGWQVFVNDSSGNWNDTGIQVYDKPSPQPAPITGQVVSDVIDTYSNMASMTAIFGLVIACIWIIGALKSNIDIKETMVVATAIVVLSTIIAIGVMVMSAMNGVV